MYSPSVAATIKHAVEQVVASAAPSLKNRGTLNPNFGYFSADAPLTYVSGLNTELSDDLPTKFFTIAADMIVFNKSLSHVLMIFRCPHNKQNGHKCKDNLLDVSPFQYKGCLATPGGFFDFRKDMSQDGQPDLARTAVRELDEECKKLFEHNKDGGFSEVTFLAARLNNFRDVRWYTSTNYVPTLAAQFTARLLEDAADGQPPKVKGSDDACGVAYWVDTKIIDAVYEEHKDSFESFDDEFSQSRFDMFVNDPNHFVLDEGTRMPRNKLKSENGLLAAVAQNGAGRPDVLHFDANANYRFSDFAFDHVRNVRLAKLHIASKLQ